MSPTANTDEPTLVRVRQAATALFGQRRNRRIAAAASVAVFQRLMQVASTLVMMPLLLRVLGPAEFGVWGAAASMAWFSGFVDIGTGTALVTLVARSTASDRVDEVRRHIAGALGLGVGVAGLMLLVALFASVVGVAQGRALPYLIAVVGLALNVPLSAANNIWMALQKGYVSGFWEFVQTLLTFVGMIGVSMLTTDVWVYVAVVYAGLVLSNIGSFVHLFLRHPELRPEGLFVPLASMRLVAGQGMMYFMLGLAGCLYFAFDNVLALELLGPEASARMTIALRICITAASVIGVVAQPLWPAFTEAAEKGDRHWIFRMLVRGTALLVSLVLAGSIVILTFGERLLRWWLHGGLDFGATLLWAISTWILAQAFVRLPNLLLNGLSIIRYQIVVVCLVLPLAFALKFALVPRLGVAGILWGTGGTTLAIIAPAFLWRIHLWEKQQIRVESE